MIAPPKKKTPFKFPSAKIEAAIKGAMPKGITFDLRVADSSIGKMKIVRVVTPAWKSIRPAERIERVIEALQGKLTLRERKAILRFSVMTPAEYEQIVVGKPTKKKAGA